MKSQEEIENEAFPQQHLYSRDAQVESLFRDNFVTPVKIQSNENGLMMPDSQKYLQTLEQKLNKLKHATSRTTQSSNHSAVKEMLRTLAEKREEAFNKETSDLFSNVEEDDDSSNKLISTLQSLAVVNKIEQKFFPHRQALNKEELQKLTEKDILNINKEELDEHINK